MKNTISIKLIIFTTTIMLSACGAHRYQEHGRPEAGHDDHEQHDNRQR